MIVWNLVHRVQSQINLCKIEYELDYKTVFFPVTGELDFISNYFCSYLTCFIAKRNVDSFNLQWSRWPWKPSISATFILAVMWLFCLILPGKAELSNKCTEAKMFLRTSSSLHHIMNTAVQESQTYVNRFFFKRRWKR